TEFVAWLVKKAHERRALGRQYAKQAEFIGVLADKAHRGAVRVFLEAGPEPLIVDRFDTATEPAPEEEQLLTIGCIAEDGRPVALLLDPENRAKVGRWLNPSTANGEDLPAYRAEHDSIVMGLYQTPEEARRHCETKVQQEEPSGSIQHMSWWADDTGDEATYELHITPAETDGLIRGTGYVVTPLTVAAAYDAEADE
ncbi:hypothetical protein NBG84_39915, partial [Streptomyces sp. CWNU-1]|nr:hypothetical protein [Streptomyces sp. CWNU-1]